MLKGKLIRPYSKIVEVLNNGASMLFHKEQMNMVIRPFIFYTYGNGVGMEMDLEENFNRSPGS